ncbi:hypothetical protein V5O48_015270 [Marasmius crinis-equi]|uniref:Uncharacterized protein n=1 Tax=Marasmius crinis-equi TaxID=585013 RepID=A0ABR3EV02_9AGAR
MSDVPAKRPASDSETERQNVRQRVEVKVEPGTWNPSPNSPHIRKLREKNGEMQRVIQEFLQTTDDACIDIQEQDQATSRIYALEAELNARKSKHEEDIRNFKRSEQTWAAALQITKLQLQNEKQQNETLKAELESLRGMKKRVHELVMDDPESTKAKVPHSLPSILAVRESTLSTSTSNLTLPPARENVGSAPFSSMTVQGLPRRHSIAHPPHNCPASTAVALPPHQPSVFTPPRTFQVHSNAARLPPPPYSSLLATSYLRPLTKSIYAAAK